jgi:uncharacterized membrane protein
VLLAGLSARLQRLRGSTPAELSRYLARRGLFLVALELLVLRPLIWFNLDYSFAAHLQVIWVIGWSMVVLAGLVRLPPAVSAAFGLALVLGHDLLDRYQVAWPADSPGEILWVLLHQKAPAVLGERIAFVQYPLVPWVGVMALGYALGGAWALERAARVRLLLRLGAGTLALFLVLRATNLYGDPRPWSVQASAWRTAASFLALEKYPPSLLFLAMTLGPALLALAALDGVRAGRLARPLVVFGRVPLFFYVLQWPAVHLAARLFQLATGQPLGWDAVNPLTLGPSLPEGCGFGLGAVYLAWALILVALWPLSAAYGGLKRRRRDWRALSYL